MVIDVKVNKYYQCDTSKLTLNLEKVYKVFSKNRHTFLEEQFEITVLFKAVFG